MKTLDDENYLVDPASVSPWPVAIRYGLIGGLIYCIYALVGNMSGLTTGGLGFVAQMVSSLLVLVIAVALIVFPVKHHRDKELGGYITIGRVIMIGFVVTAISMAISMAFNYIYMNFIDPGYIDSVLVSMEEMLESMVPEDQLEQALIDARARLEPASMAQTGVITTLVIGIIVSAIVGLIMKKDPPRV